ncbi:MAG: TonB family protein [Candidatus Tectomicrobia bacterium]|nr:TonB family protein [Candidatus Tectomicrobia bacterium]
MAADRRIALITFLIAVLIHLAIVLGLSQFPWPVTSPQPTSVRQSVVHLRRSVSTPARMPALAAPVPAPLAPPALPMPMRQPQPSPPTPWVLSRPQPTRVAKAAPARKSRAIPQPQVRQPQKPKAEPRPPVMPQPAPPVPQTPVPAATAPEQPAIAAPSAPPPAPAAAEPELKRTYLALVAETLQRHQHYPLSARRRGLSGQVVLQFTIQADGRITDPQITDSAGHAVFRSASLRVLKRAGTMPPFPPELRQPQLTVKIPMVYELEASREPAISRPAYDKR